MKIWKMKIKKMKIWKMKESINKWTAFIQEVFKDEQSDIMEIMQKNGKKKFL